VLLFTDGQANVGIQDPQQLVVETKNQLAAGSKDVTIVTFGFGRDHNASLLQRLAEATQGTYYFVERSDQMKEMFADCLGGLLSIVATNIRLHLEVSRALPASTKVTITKVMTTFPHETLPDGSIVVKMKDLFAEEKRDVLAQLTITSTSPISAAEEILSFRLEYDNVLVSAKCNTVAVCRATYADARYAGSPNMEVDEQLCRFRTTEALEEAKRLADAGRVREANEAITVACEQVANAPSKSSAFNQHLHRDLECARNATTSSAAWANMGQHKVARMAAGHAQQRCNDLDDADMYCTSAKMAFRSKAK